MQTIIVDTTPGFRMPTINYSQGDIGRTFAIDLRSRFGDSLPASPTITIQATKPSGLGFSVASTSISGAVVTFTVTETMSNEAGRFPAELKIVKSGTTLFTANFYIECEASAHPEGTTDGDLDSISPKFMSVTTTTLPAGDSATYSYDPETNTATFGIPKGADGSLASQVLAADYSSSKTYAVGDYVYYNGNLYRCSTAITTAEAWTSGHWTQVALGDDVTDLKSALNLVFTDGTTISPVAPTNWNQGYIKSDGSIGSSNTNVYSDRYLINADLISVAINTNYRAKLCEYDTSNVFVKDIFGYTNGTLEAQITRGHYYRLCIYKTDSSNIAPSDIPTDTVVITTKVQTDKTLTVNGFPADAKAVGDKIDELETKDEQSVKSSEIVIRNATGYTDCNDFPINSIITITEDKKITNAPPGTRVTGHIDENTGAFYGNVMTYSAEAEATHPTLISQICTYYLESNKGEPRIATRSAIWSTDHYEWSNWSTMSECEVVHATNKVVDIDHLSYTFSDFNDAPPNGMYQIDLNVGNTVLNNPSPNHSGMLLTLAFSAFTTHARVQLFFALENTITMYFRYGYLSNSTMYWTAWEKVNSTTQLT